MGLLLMVLGPNAAAFGCATEVSGTAFDDPDAPISEDPGDGEEAGPPAKTRDSGTDGSSSGTDARTDTRKLDTGGADGGAPPPSPDDGGAPPPAADDLQHCVDVINSYRAKLGRTPYKRSSALEAFAAEGAKEDSKSGSPHGHFMATSGGGIAWAENEIPGWSLADSGSVRAVLDDGLKMMWDEGPGGGHYENMSSRSYKEVGCGIYVTPSKDVWIVQDFR